MGFVLTLLYVTLSYLSPADMFPDLGSTRIMVWLAIAAVVTSVPCLVMGNFPFRARQVYLMLGLIVAVAASRLAHLWFGGVLPGLESFFTSGVVFFLVLTNVHTLPRLNILMTVCVLTCLYLLSQSGAAYYAGGEQSPFFLQQGYGLNPATGEYTGVLTRIRALGFLNDPNDFAQYLLTTLPFLGFAWKQGRTLRNLVLVLLPACFVLYGVYLTQSRGAVVGLAVILLTALKDWLGKRGIVIATILVVVLVMSGLTGPRDISASEPSADGRLMEWGTGMSLLASAPVFGVGYDGYTDHSDITAHNSFVLCFAELGLFGYFFWLGLIVYTILDLNEVLGLAQESAGNAEMFRAAKLLRMSLFAFVATAWFLSRTYVVTFYLILGMAIALVQMLKHEPRAAKPAPPWSRWRMTAAVEVASLVVVYAFVKMRVL